MKVQKVLKLVEFQSSEFSLNPVSDYITDEPFMTAGQQLQADLGLEKYGRNCWVQKVIGYALPIYIISFNSRYPTVNFGQARIKKIKTSWVGRVKRKGIHTYIKGVKLTPPLSLQLAMLKPVSGSIIIMRDFAGDILSNPKFLRFTKNV